MLRRPDGDGRIGSSSNEDGDGNENGKKAISSHYYDVKVPISRVVENSGTQDNNFPELWYSPLAVQLQKIVANVWQIKQRGIRARKFEAAGIHILSDVFVALRRRCCLSSPD